MASSKSTNTSLQLSLPNQSWFGDTLYLYGGFWCFDHMFEGITTFQSQFQAHDTDIIIASLPKAGTTWLKSLLFSVVNRKNLSSMSLDTLHSKNPHELVPQFEVRVYKDKQYNLSEAPSPRLFATHLPYLSLPDSIKTSKCRIVYICRNPWDTFVSIWHFFLRFEKNKGIEPNTSMMDELVGKYCMGISPFGPYEDHLLGYWKQCKENNPQQVLFLEYEGLKKEPKIHLRKLAEFIGCPFSKDEEEGSIIDDIINICSIKSLKEMEVNKSGMVYPVFGNKAFFRKGEVGDWTNYLTPTMAKKFNHIQENLKNGGFSFTYYPMKVE